MKKSTALLWLAALAALLIAATRWLDHDPTPEVQAAAPTRAATNADSAHAIGGAAPATAPATAAAAAEPAHGGEQRTSVAVASLGSLEPARRAARALRVVNALTGAPVAGALIRYESLEAGARHETHRALQPERCHEWMRELGPSARSGGDGLVELETEFGRACVLNVAHDGLFGLASFAADEEGIKTVDLVPDADIEVLVLGPGDAAAPDLAVALRRRVHGSIEDRRTQRTDAEGRVRLADVGLELHADANWPWSVAVVGLSAPSAERTLEPQALPREPIVLRTGATGAVELVAKDLDGAPLRSGWVELRVDDAPPDAPPSFWKSGEYAAMGLSNGRALFEQVRLGEALIAHLTPEGSPSALVKRFAGPRTHGERVVVEVVLDQAAAVVVFRLLDESGAPLRERDVAWNLSVSSKFNRSANSGRLRSDAEGRIEYVVASPWGADTERVLHLTLESSQLFPPQARIDLSRHFENGRHDLGDVRLGERPLVAAGRVVDAAGALVAGANVRVVNLPGKDGLWDDFDEEVECDAAGRFIVRGEAKSEYVNVRASTRTAKSDELLCASGASDLVLTLVEGGRIAGRVLVDSPAVTTAVLARAVRTDGGEYKVTGLKSDGAFALENLTPGDWTLTLEANGSQSDLPFIELTGLHLPSGAACADPRLNELDLRGRLSALTVEIVAPNASDRVLGLAIVTPKGATTTPPATPIQRMLTERSITVVAEAESFDLRVVTSGYRTVERSGIRGEVRIELERGPLVRLRAPAGMELPEPPIHLKPFLVAVGADATMVGHFQDVVLGADREVRVFAPGSGEFEVEWLVETRLESSLSTWTIDVGTPQRVRIAESAGEQVIDLVPPLMEIADAVARARRQED